MFVEEVNKCANPSFVLAFDELIDTLVELLDQQTTELDFPCVALGVVDDEVGEIFSFDDCLVLCEELSELFVPEAVDNVLKIVLTVRWRTAFCLIRVGELVEQVRKGFMEGPQGDRLISFVSDHTVEIDELLRSGKMLCDLILNLLEFSTEIDSVLDHLVDNDSQLDQNIDSLGTNLISINELSKGSNRVTFHCHFIEQISVEMRFGFTEDSDYLFLVLMREIVVLDQVKDLNRELLAVLLAALLGILGKKCEKFKLFRWFGVLQAHLITEIAKDTEGRVISKIGLAIIIDLVKDVAMDLLINLHETWQLSYIF